MIRGVSRLMFDATRKTIGLVVLTGVVGVLFLVYFLRGK